MSSLPVERNHTLEQEEEVIIPTEPYHDEEERPAQSEEEEEEVVAPPPPQPQATTRTRLPSQNSYEASVVSTQSSPPPYELYPPANTVFGRMFNWLRKIPRLNTHQAIYLPTLPIHTSSRSRSIFSRRSRRGGRGLSSSASSTTVDMAAGTTTTHTAAAQDSEEEEDDDDTSVSCWSYYYYTCMDHLPEPPHIVLPTCLAHYRTLLICISFFSLTLFSFLLFCSIYFAPIDYPPPVFPDKVISGNQTSARFLTLNIFMRPPLIKNNWSDFKDDRLAYIEKYILPEYDVIAFQESFAFATRRKDHLISEAIKLGFNYHLESPRKYPWQIGVDGGLLLVSKFPIRESNVIEYPRGQHSDW